MDWPKGGGMHVACAPSHIRPNFYFLMDSNGTRSNF